MTSRGMPCQQSIGTYRKLAQTNPASSWSWLYITDIARKPEFNRAWDEWVDRANLPLRACVGASLEHDDLIELVVTAARGPDS